MLKHFFQKIFTGVFKLCHFNGAGISASIAEASGSILIGVGTGNLGCVGGIVGKDVKAYDMAGNVVETARGVYAISQNGLTVSNALSVAGGVADARHDVWGAGGMENSIRLSD